MLEVYGKYLKVIDSDIEKFFEQQNPYICCEKGCSKCCESGTYPVSRLELEYMLLGFSLLPDEQKVVIEKNLEELFAGKSNCGENKFLHKCPFLIDNICSIYSYRALVCRSYGLICTYYDEDKQQKHKLPYCVESGLNYSSVYDSSSGTISSAKWRELGISVEPVAHNVDYTFLSDNETTQQLNLDFGQVKNLLDWFFN